MEEAKVKFSRSLDHAGREAPDAAERRDVARNRGRVLGAARALFEERDVVNVTMEEIARAAGVGKGTLYRRFPHKGLLCYALLDEPTRAFQAETLAGLAEAGVGPIEKLDLFLDRLVRFTDANLDLLYGGHETLDGTERLAHFAHPSYGWLRGTVLVLLRTARRSGELDEDLDADYLADALLAPWAWTSSTTSGASSGSPWSA
ncbi:TetR family transcriptional regulator [Rubrobacter marinus]|uniref:TetR family transcriptional regulator n=1 Tax=Rubrobacter marinus TaxID=2653852 RepID=A0A6G8PYM4_9ACTN|nr:TetR/AcrR family transcriptional regulator [Rubrobacter marinus]QIN79313.1 TetR family transcriptional regulator [Rubrobacter marinus]